MLPPPHIPNTEKHLAEYNAAMSAALNISSNSSTSPASSGRPSYKRLASQILESAAIKRARDDLNNTSAIDDDGDDDEHYSQRQREGSTESNEPGSSAAVSSMDSHSGHSLDHRNSVSQPRPPSPLPPLSHINSAPTYLNQTTCGRERQDASMTMPQWDFVSTVATRYQRNRKV